MQEQLISIKEIIGILKKRKMIIAVITIIFTLSSVVISFFIIKPKYEANTKFFIGKESTEINESYSQSDVIMYQALMKTYSEVIQTKDIILRATKEANLNLEVEEVLNGLNVITIADTQILEVKFRSEDAKESRALIEGITQEFINISKELVPNGRVKILQEVTLPEKPISPNKKINILIGFLLGLIVSTGLVFLLEFLDETIKTKDELEKEIDIPVIGLIQNMNKYKED